VGRVDPVTMAADKGGALFVADADRDRVLAFDVSGTYRRTIGGFGARPGSFRGLSGLAVTPRGGLVAAERVNQRLQWLDAGGRVTGSWPIAAASGPGALPVAVDDSSRVAIADETTGRLWLFDGGGRALAALAGLDRPRSLAWAPDGTLLVAEAGRGTVRRFALERAGAPPGTR
jgi:sugar lactone lactonase YvrE